MATFAYYSIYGMAVIDAKDIEEAKAGLQKRYPLLFTPGWPWRVPPILLEEGQCMFINGRANLHDYYDFTQEKEFGYYHDREPYTGKE